MKGNFSLLKEGSPYGVVGVYRSYYKALDAMHQVAVEIFYNRKSIVEETDNRSMSWFLSKIRYTGYIKMIESGIEWDEIGNLDRSNTIYLVCVRKDIPRH